MTDEERRAILRVQSLATTLTVLLLQREYGERFNSMPDEPDDEVLTRISLKAVEWAAHIEAHTLEAANASFEAEKEN